jgi:hypothetical protein
MRCRRTATIRLLWIFYMSETFIQHVLSSIEQMLKVLGQFVAANWPEGQTLLNLRMGTPPTDWSLPLDPRAGL